MRTRWFRILAAAAGRPLPLVSRREAMAQALGVAGTMLLSRQTARASASRNLPRVLVVGAGLGGCVAAHELHAAGFDVHVCEARRRVGGRAVSLTDWVPGRVVEAGGEFIGANQPLWLAYARQFGLSLAEVGDEQSVPIICGGLRYEGPEVELLYDEVVPLEAQLTAAAQAVPPAAPWDAPNAASLDAKSVEQALHGLSATRRSRDFVRMLLTHDDANSTSQMSYLGLLANIAAHGGRRYWTETEAFRCAEGNASLARKLLEPLGSERVHLDLPVLRIAWQTTPLRVTTADERVWECDDIILAVPPSTWSKIQFDTPPHEALTPQMGQVVKFMTQVRRRYWEQTGPSPGLISEALPGVVWEATQGQPGDGPAVVTCFAGGPLARQLASQPPAAASATCRRAVEAHMPNLANQRIDERWVNWPASPWTQGGYSFPAPGQVLQTLRLLHDGLGRLHFAGEHTSPGFFGFMEGALESGVRVARHLARREGILAANEVSR